MSNERTREELKETVLLQIGTGKKLSRTEEWISALTGIHERLVRKLIEELRGDGHLICNDQDGEGYYIAESIDEVRRQYARDRSRALHVLYRLRPFRSKLREAERNLNQTTLFEKE